MSFENLFYRTSFKNYPTVYHKVFTKFGQRLRHLDEKLASGASWLGNKAGSALINASPVLTAINPALGAAAVGSGGVLRGVGTLGDIGKRALHGQVDVDMVSQARGALGSIRDDARAIQQAYNSVRSPARGSPLERRG